MALAHHLGCPFVPEMARSYLENLGRTYTAADVEQIARLQLEEEDRLGAESRGFLICDTTLLVIKIWMMHAYGQCPEWILDSIKQRKYDLYLLTDIDLPWQPDPLREHPDLRQFFKSWYEAELIKLKVKWKLISGKGGQRTHNALTEIQNHFGDC